jgi:hypothetical protein
MTVGGAVHARDTILTSGNWDATHGAQQYEKSAARKGNYVRVLLSPGWAGRER